MEREIYTHTYIYIYIHIHIHIYIYIYIYICAHTHDLATLIRDPKEPGAFKAASQRSSNILIE